MRESKGVLLIGGEWRLRNCKEEWLEKKNFNTDVV